MIKKNLEIYNNDTYRFVTSTNPIIIGQDNSIVYDDKGIYSEVIFGPARDYMCKCGEIYNKLNDGVICPYCNVLCGDSNIRTKTWANIKLPFYMINYPFLNVLQTIFGRKEVKEIVDTRHHVIDNLIHEPLYWDDVKEKLVSYLPDETLMLNDAPLKIDNPLALYMAFNTLKQKNFYKITQFHDDLLNVLFIKYIPVSPPSIRPINIVGSSVKISELSVHYNNILFALENNIQTNMTLDIILSLYREIYKSWVSIIDRVVDVNFVGNRCKMRTIGNGKNIGYSSYNVIVPDPTLSVNGISLTRKTTKDILEHQYKRFVYSDILGNSQAGTFDAYKKAISGEYDAIQKERIDTAFFNYITTSEGQKETNILIERAPVLRPYNITGVNLEQIIDLDKGVQYDS